MPQTYQILHAREPVAGAYAPRGAVKDLWNTRDFETIVSGPAETGKTWGCLQYLNALMWRYPGANGVIARKTFNDLQGTVLRTWQRVLGDESPVRPFGGQRPTWYDYPNGSRVWLAGLDRPGKSLSAERDVVYVNQCEELKLEDWEILTTRTTGRGAVMPYTRVFGDCNPDAPTHWIKKRLSIKLLESRHEDNPTLFDLKGNITPQGRKTMAILDALTGTRRMRLRFGRWVQAEGVVYDGWGEHNLIDEMPRGWEEWRKFRSVDFGYTNPFVCQWWAIDGDGRMYLYREIYMSHRIVELHVNGVRDPDDRNRIIHPGITALSAGERYEVTVADHDREDRETMNEHGVPTRAAMKGQGSILRGVNAVAERLCLAGDGRPRLFVLRGCTVEHDDLLSDLKLPTRTQDEPDSYVWKRGKDGKILTKEEPVDENNHGMDAMRYAVMYVDHMSKGKTQGARVEVF